VPSSKFIGPNVSHGSAGALLNVHCPNSRCAMMLPHRPMTLPGAPTPEPARHPSYNRGASDEPRRSGLTRFGNRTPSLVRPKKNRQSRYSTETPAYHRRYQTAQSFVAHVATLPMLITIDTCEVEGQLGKRIIGRLAVINKPARRVHFGRAVVAPHRLHVFRRCRSSSPAPAQHIIGIAIERPDPQKASRRHAESAPQPAARRRTCAEVRIFPASPKLPHGQRAGRGRPNAAEPRCP